MMVDPMQTTHDELIEAVAASADAGFTGVSVWTLYTAAIPPDDVRSILDDHGVAGSFVEGVFAWANAPDDAAALADVEAALAVAELVGASEIQAVMLEPELEDVDRAIQRFRVVCDRAAEDGVGIALEFLPWTGIPDLDTAWRIIDGADRPNAGLCLDTWHWVRQPGGPAPDLLRSIPGDRIHLLQVCDAAADATDDALTECMTNRLLLGDGVVDLPEVLAILDEIGADPIVSPEIFSTALVAEGKAAMAKKVHDSTQAALG